MARTADMLREDYVDRLAQSVGTLPPDSPGTDPQSVGTLPPKFPPNPWGRSPRLVGKLVLRWRATTKIGGGGESRRRDCGRLVASTLEGLCTVERLKS